jgi:hypothetical protein
MEEQNMNQTDIPITIEELYQYGQLDDTTKKTVASAVVTAIIEKKKAAEEKAKARKPGFWKQLMG